MNSDSDIDCDENLFDESFFKSLLSFMNDDADNSSCSSGYASEIFSPDNVVTSGYVDTMQHNGELIYKNCNFSNRLYTSWTTSSVGLTPSTQEAPKIATFKDYQEVASLKALGKGEAEKDVFNQDILNDFEPTKKDKNLMFAKYVKNSLLMEFQNHPGRPKQINEEYVNSSSQVVPKLDPLPCTQITPTFDQIKENCNPNVQRLKICKFCFKNGEPPVVYMGHFLKSPNGSVSCPILRRYVCDICGATGAKSHTRRYCPMNTEPIEISPQFRKLANGVLAPSLSHK